MGVILHIPCEDGKLSRIEITPALDMTFLDCDINYEIAFHAMGGEPSICYQADEAWRDNPLGFMLLSGLVPALHLGVVACGLVRKAIPIVEAATKLDNGVPNCLRPAMGLASVCERQLKQFRRDISKLHHWKQDLIHAWNSRVTGALKSTPTHHLLAKTSWLTQRLNVTRWSWITGIFKNKTGAGLSRRPSHTRLRNS